MEQWTPLKLFIVTCGASALAGLAGYLRSDKTITLRGCASAILYSGAIGSFTSMLGFEFLGGKEKPWRVIAVGGLIGLGLFSSEEIKAFIGRFIGAGGGGK